MKRIGSWKKSLAAIGAVLALGAGLSSCGKGGDAKKLYIFNWSVYMPSEVLRDFEKRFGVQIVYDEYTSNEEMLAKIQSGAAGYDIVVPSGDHVSIMKKLGLLETIDKSRVPNFKNLDASLLARIKFDEGNEVSVPYFIGAAGVAVNTDKVKSFPRDFSLFEDAKLKGRMTLLDDQREVLGAALKRLGYSVNDTDEAHLAKATELVLKWKANIQKFDADAFGKSYAAGEFWVVHGYAENVYRELAGNPDLKAKTAFFIAKEGNAMYMDSMVILKTAKHKDLAYQFINYIHEPAVYARIADGLLLLPAVNVEARKLTTNRTPYTLDDLKNCEFKEDLGPGLEAFNKAWKKIRVEN